MRRVGWFCGLEGLAENLDALPRLVERAGLTTLMPESHLTHTSGFAVSAEVAAQGPLEGWRERPELPAHREAFHLPPEANAALPGIVAGGDDRPLLAILEAARGLGLEVWGHIGLWCYGGEVFPEYAMRNAEGGIATGTEHSLGVGFCPSRSELNDWIEACLVDATRRYGVDGWFVDHARYPSPGNIPSLWGCACASCAAEAERLGHDFERLLAGLRRSREAFGRMDVRRLGAWLRSGITPLDLWQMDGVGELREWFQYRADLLTAAMARFRSAVRTAAGRPIPFGADVFPPSIALLGGHDYPTWETAVDYMTGGHGGNVGWSLVPAATVAAFARELCEWAPGLAGPDALALVRGLFGYDRSGLPDRIEAFRTRGGSSHDVMLEHELRKAAALRSGRVPVYPPMNARRSGESMRAVCELMAELGFEGAVFGGLDGAEEDTLAAIRTSFVGE